MADMQFSTGYTRREITDVIKQLRKDYPICSTREAPGGYWLGDSVDIKRMEAYYEKSINTMQQTIDNLSKFKRGKEVAHGDF